MLKSTNKYFDNIYLSDISDKSYSWHKHKINSEIIANYYYNSEFASYAQRIQLCSQLLGFELVSENQEFKLKLSSAQFCRVRTCPICQWRKSLQWKAKAYKVLSLIADKYQNHRWLFLTLTVKNCYIRELRNTLVWLNQSWQRMSQRKKFPAIGWIRTTEITMAKNQLAHPHFHCLLLVRPSYFGKYYLKQYEWVNLWRSSLRIDYNPILDIRPLKLEKKPTELIPEILKYCVKESDLIQNREWLLEFTRQTKNMRTIATGGILKQYFKQLETNLEKDSNNLKSLGNTNQLVVYWKYKEKRYIVL